MDFEFASIDQLVEDARAGRMFVMVDNENRENEGDLIASAEMITDEQIAFMAKQGSGLICMPMRSDMVDDLELELVGRRNNRHSTAFTISIEAKEGVTTGISAADRAHTIRTACATNAKIEDLATPGHVFPLRAADGGVLAREGHTEATVDLMVMAGLRPAGVICEIMNEDGTMSRMPELVSFARKHKMNIGRIDDMVRVFQGRESAVA